MVCPTSHVFCRDAGFGPFSGLSDNIPIVCLVFQEKRVIHVEAMVTAEELVNAALAHGLVPKVVPTFRHVTVGGAVSLRNRFLAIL